MSLELKNVEKKVGIDTHIHPTNLRFEKNTINVIRNFCILFLILNYLVADVKYLYDVNDS